MKRLNPAAGKFSRAFTLIELLVVIAIIGILAGLLLPALSRAKLNTQKKFAQSEENTILSAISQYHAQYGRLPASSGAVTAAASPQAAANSNDFTFGTVLYTVGQPGGGGNLASLLNVPVIKTLGVKNYQNYNSEIISILRDDLCYPEANTNTSPNVQHIYNPQKSSFLNAKMASDTNSPGIGTDDVFRDPWGAPYIITEDLNYDNKCFDAALSGMYSRNANNPGVLMIPGEAVVWSLGWSYKTIDLNGPLNSGINKQSIVTSF